ncbi:MAG: hypothetical protein CME62_00730 [Halobacteriovoraceae bacterium]|nr:hypothetical protein [Halobacteriovoraceae bacterium]|tara:strand:- start:13607 stop:14680 length:1074 start_codon:yes stop_codon:yes gene_type:complete
MYRKWLYCLNFYFNFLFGALIPLMPLIDEEKTGQAFSAFSLAKVLLYLPAGYLVDKWSPKAVLWLALIAQAMAFFIFAFVPEMALVARLAEGGALAMGTIGALSLLRLINDHYDGFKRDISLLMLFGGVAFLVAPLSTYLLLMVSLQFTLYFLFGFSLLMLILALYFNRISVTAMTETFKDNEKQKAPIFSFILCLFLVKAFMFGYNPNLAWWMDQEFHFSPLVSGFYFFGLGVAFLGGCAYQKKIYISLGAISYLGLEGSLYYQIPWFWFICLVGVAFWMGQFITRSIAFLGWSDPIGLGKHNSYWLLFTDLGMIVTPVLFWQWRDQEDFRLRTITIFVIIVMSVVAFIKGKREAA